ncbi:MAG: GAP family protein [Actinomycetota bacterium]
MGFFELALISSVSPQTLAVVLYLLGGTRGLRHAWLFVAGLLITSVTSGALVAYGIVDLGIRPTGLGDGRRFPAVYITAGILLLLFAGYVLWRHLHARSRPREHDRRKEDARLERMVESSKVSFAVGLLFGLPGVWYALALVETTGHGAWYTAATIVVFSLISSAWAWIPILWFMADHQRALRMLTALRTAAGRHRIAIIVAVLVLVGTYLIVLGVLTL